MRMELLYNVKNSIIKIMKRVFSAEIIWDTNDEHGLSSAVEDCVADLNTREGIEAVAPHIYPENPIVINIGKK